MTKCKEDGPLVDVWWEELAEALSRNIMDKWSSITAVSLSIEVHEDITNDKVEYRQPSQHGCIITIGDITPLQPAPVVEGEDNFVSIANQAYPEVDVQDRSKAWSVYTEGVIESIQKQLQLERNDRTNNKLAVQLDGIREQLLDIGKDNSMLTFGDMLQKYYADKDTQDMNNDPTPGVKITSLQLRSISRKDGIYNDHTHKGDIGQLREKCESLFSLGDGKVTYSMLVEAAKKVSRTGTTPIHPAFIEKLHSELDTAQTDRVKLDLFLRDTVRVVEKDLVDKILDEMDTNHGSGSWRRRLGERQRLYDAPRRR